MGSKWVMVLVIFMFVSLQGCLSQTSGCWEEERVALLQLKHFFNDPNSLQDWVEGDQHNNSDCCQWRRVECNNSTGRVISLNLLGARDWGLREGYLNASLFSAFEQLEELDLWGNSIAGFVDNGGLDKLSRLRNLESLDLSFNMFNNDIFSSLIALPSLKSLYLHYNRLNETVDLQGLDSCKNLKVLCLGGNQIEKVVFPKGLDKLSRLRNLEYLELGYNMFNNDILSSLNALPSLTSLDLWGNRLNETIDLQGLDSCKNLKELDLSNNQIEKVVFPKGALSSLKELHLNDNRLKGIVDVPDSLNNLEVMDMSNNEIDKFVFRKGLKKLDYLDLQNVSIHDGISSLLHSLASLPSLRVLHLSYNNFSESTTTKDGSSHHSIAAFTNLEELYLQNCQIYGTSSFQDLLNFTSLTDLNMDDSTLDISFFQIGMMASLEFLSLTNCELQGSLSNQDGGAISKFLNHQQYLRSLDLSNNNLTGGFPNWLLENNAELEDLNLANNLLGGYLSIHSHMNLTSLDISDNSFQGHIPKEVAEHLPSLETLYLSRNHFDGSIPSSIGDLNSLQSLDLSYNNLSGEIPEHLAEGCTSLSVLVLSNNKLRGKIFSAKFNLTDLRVLQLNGNSFTGSIPDSLSKASNLEGLYLGDNKLSGTIPSWLGNMSSLEVIMMPNNHFEGPIPLEFCQFHFLEVLNLAKNNLSGSLPSCSTPLSIKHVHLSKNKLQGQLKEAFFNSSSIVTLDLGHNHFDDRIPTWIGRLSQLTYLVLSNNNLEGDVPTQLCQLNQLRLVDLSHNNLSGYIPPCLDFTALHSSDHEVVGPNCDRYGYRYRTCLPATQRTKIEESVEFTTKTISYSYHGKVLTYMFGVDLSCNKLTGPIPPQVGNLTRIHTLNLSHNNLTGQIPMTFSKLEQIECLDLSYNNLKGKIPPQLVELNTLSSFNVAHNNLSGKTPERVAQFNTFDENSYEGNPLLCGPPLHKSCETTRQPSPMPGASTDKEKDNDLIDMDIFYMSFTGSYIIVLLGIAAVLYINPYWRRAWFYLAETWMTSFYYFIVDNLPHRFCH